jgi:hypothetical protein
MAVAKKSSSAKSISVEELVRHFHITEVGHVQKDFIDCGGTRRATSSCVLQAWVAKNDEEHSLQAGKLAKIWKLADKILPSGELLVEVELRDLWWGHRRV